MSGMTKQQREFDIFCRFVDLAKIQIDFSSVTQPSPPAPDIVCKISGVDYGFELTALTEEVGQSNIVTQTFELI